MMEMLQNCGKRKVLCDAIVKCLRGLFLSSHSGWRRSVTLGPGLVFSSARGSEGGWRCRTRSVSICLDTEVLQKKTAMKKANHKWHKCGFKDKDPKIYRSMQKGLETSLTAAIWISTWIKKNKLTLRRTFPLPLSRLGLSGCPQHPPPRYSSAWYFPHSATSRSPIFAQSLLEI